VTAGEKAALARFLGLACASSRGGYAGRPPERAFLGDPDPPEAEAGAPGGGAHGSGASAGGAFSEGPGGSAAGGAHGGGACSSGAAGGPAPGGVCFGGAPPEGDSIGRIEEEIRACRACRLAQGRQRAAPGEGSLSPAVMVIGEGPGAEEDKAGRPFVGRAGQLLDRMLGAIGLSRGANCFIANVVKCRPPGNRDPLPDEIAACAPFLERQARLLRPAFVLCAGRVAAQALLGSGEGIGRLRGKISALRLGGADVPFLATYHPSALLRSEDLKRPAWEDLKLLRSALEEAGIDLGPAPGNAAGGGAGGGASGGGAGGAGEGGAG